MKRHLSLIDRRRTPVYVGVMALIASLVVVAAPRADADETVVFGYTRT